ncbi:hypothetical protein SAMN04488544_1103 [Microlunatus sagamiharensis]|uniref:OLD protein-like TOPRIM domain-containing protein n=1 Tax=Microlunatus sagamiharensis TaxID=546874 RepID=A0A1H2LZG5_9ACTN|nr:TOPRIM nucleotidyl transferase/hydrolase domain-containing protein [Microlunatus sagamiharensis]SDU86098.1 hypothetical protein SAMN04488544_1103 [Microlunatus sagamiharensis]
MGTTVLVEGESDRLAIESLARRDSLDLAALGVRVVGMGGATSLRHFLPRDGDERVLGLVDEAEARWTLRVLEAEGVGSGRLAERGFRVCRADLEDELIRCLGSDAVLAVVEAQGELASFGRLRHQPALRGLTLVDQLRRFLAGRSGHKITYARLLVEALPAGRAPEPLARLLADLH